MSKKKDKCDTCEHRGDSSNEYCGSCGGGVESNWKEAGWSKDKTINELRTRVAELEQRMIDQANMICKKSNEADMERRTAEMHCADAVKLSKRVEELEKLIEWHKQDTHDAMEWKRELEKKVDDGTKELRLSVSEKNIIQNRLSTLMKASEGMEKALEEITKVRNLRYNIPVATDEQMIAIKALADFRALKEKK